MRIHAKPISLCVSAIGLCLSLVRLCLSSICLCVFLPSDFAYLPMPCAYSPLAVSLLYGLMILCTLLTLEPSFVTPSSETLGLWQWRDLSTRLTEITITLSRYKRQQLCVPPTISDSKQTSPSHSTRMTEDRFINKHISTVGGNVARHGLAPEWQDRRRVSRHYGKTPMASGLKRSDKIPDGAWILMEGCADELLLASVRTRLTDCTAQYLVGQTLSALWWLYSVTSLVMGHRGTCTLKFPLLPSRQGSRGKIQVVPPHLISWRRH